MTTDYGILNREIALQYLRPSGASNEVHLYEIPHPHPEGRSWWVLANASGWLPGSFDTAAEALSSIRGGA